MTNHISIAYAQASTGGSDHAVLTENASLRHRLAMLWIGQTLSNMFIIGISRREAIQMVNTALAGWCGHDGNANEPAKR